MYVPILKGKEGEFAALEELKPEIKVQVKPLIQIPAVPFNFSTGKSAKTLYEHIRTLPERIRRSLGGQLFYLETPYFGTNEQIDDDRCALGMLLEESTKLQLRPIPVLSTSSSAGCRAAVRTFTSSGGSVCLRLSISDFDENIDTEEEVRRLLGEVGMRSASENDLIIDFGDLRPDINRSLLLVRSVLSMIPERERWASIIFAAASFPEDLSGVNSSSVANIPRQEWSVWEALQRKPALIPPNLVFGDYAISHPEPRELDPRVMRMSASIRYTAPDSWLIVKGRNVSQYGFEQYFDLCRALVQRPEYRGQEFSWGDSYIWDCAEQAKGPGNATTWRKVGVNHHITLVARQLTSSL